MGGMFVALILWIAFIAENPGGGSGNGRYSQLFGFIGGSVGAALGCAVAVFLLRRTLPRK